MGDTLGGRPEDPDCYDANGKPNYENLRNKVFFKSGIERLKKAYEQKLSVAIMCSESKPAECHRTKLIGEELVNQNIFIEHIDEKGEVKGHVQVMKQINGENANKLF